MPMIEFTNGTRTVYAEAEMSRALRAAGYRPVQPGATAAIDAEDADENAKAAELAAQEAAEAEAKAQAKAEAEQKRTSRK